MSTRTEAVERIRSALLELEGLTADEIGMAIGVPLCDLSDTALIDATVSLGRVFQATQTALAEFAAEISHRSPAARGELSLCKREGFSSTGQLVSAITGIATATAGRLARVGDAIYQGRNVDGSLRSPRHPFVADALRSNSITVEAADDIASSLDRASHGSSIDDHRRMEQLLVSFASQHTPTELHALCLKGIDVLDPDGAQPREERQRELRSLTVQQLSTGMTKFTWMLPGVDAALVTNSLISVARLVDSAPDPEAASMNSEFLADANAHNVAANSDGCAPATASYDVYGKPVGVTATLWAQKLSDAALACFEHAARCRANSVEAGTDAVPAVQLVVRVALDTLSGGLGLAEVDGAGSVSASQARQLAARAEIIPAVLGSEGELLDLGRSRRLFSRKQRIALIERDGACAWPGCGTLPGWSDAHHIEWWSRDAGPTDIANGVMLCSGHHHRIHDNGWSVVVRPPDYAPSGPPVPHFIAPAGAIAARQIPGAFIDQNGRVVLRGGKPRLSLAA